MAVIIAPIVVQYQSATMTALYVVWVVDFALLGVLAWEVVARRLLCHRWLGLKLKHRRRRSAIRSKLKLKV